MDELKQSAGRQLDSDRLSSGAPTVAPGSYLAAGSKLGRYTVVEPLGSGGMGVVYLARDEKLERSVAIKILSAGMLSGDDVRRRFQQEARALARLSHANIAALYDAGEHDGIDCLVMECVPGESLAVKIKSGSISVKDATSIVLQIAEALEEAHEQGVVHRDLKPGNVMVTPKGRVKVLDFGLAKLLESVAAEKTVSLMETRGLIGTPLYMSPEQALGKDVDARTDLWSLGVVYYELLTGKPPFQAENSMAVLRAITDTAPTPLSQIAPAVPLQAQQIIARLLAKDPADRYQSAAEVARDASNLLLRLSGASPLLERTPKFRSPVTIAAAVVALLCCASGAWWLFHLANMQRWAREKAIPQIESDFATGKPLAAFLQIKEAERYLPGDEKLKQISAEHSRTVSIDSQPAGAKIEIKDFLSPQPEWHELGITPLRDLQIPDGYFRWRVSMPGMGDMVVAPMTGAKMDFDLAAWQKAPEGMAPVAAEKWTDDVGFVGWIGPYSLPDYYVDRHEVTNRQYQKFVDSGGYDNRQYWPQDYSKDGRSLSWTEAMTLLRDSTGRAGPSTWAAGHYPEGKADFPVTGVSWFEATAYANFVGKSLPVLAQWFQVAPEDVTASAVQASNISSGGMLPVGASQGLGPYGTSDTAGNAREWVANTIDDNLRFILGGSWQSPSYQYFDPEALSPFDRSADNGFRCVKNIGTLPPAAAAPVKRVVRDLAKFKPASDDVFRAYQLLYAYPDAPLNARSEGIIAETQDWREEKVTFDTGYRGQRMAAYLFLPRNVKPPYQTVLFFPSARVLYLPDNDNGRKLGDVKFFDYIVQSGRAVMYPIYEGTYERQVNFYLPGASQSIELTVDRYKDAARSLDYLAKRGDIDSGKLGYLGVSMGSAEGVILTTLMQERLKTAVFLDGGYFLDTPPPGGDQADFVVRMKKPVLMVNGRYDFTFSVESAQNPFFKMLGTPSADKQHVILDTSHDVTEQKPQLVKAVLEWLDKYLGRVQ